MTTDTPLSPEEGITQSQRATFLINLGVQDANSGLAPRNGNYWYLLSYYGTLSGQGKIEPGWVSLLDDLSIPGSRPSVGSPWGSLEEH